MAFQGFDINGLANLLRQSDPTSRDESDSDSDTERPPSHYAGPGHIGRAKKGGDADVSGSTSKVETPKRADIWSSVEVKKEADKVNIPTVSDSRKTPQYEMYYRQSVTPEDMFLQMGNKTPSSASCENLVVEIHLPEDDIDQIHLNLKEQAIDLRSLNHFLYLGLPYPIDPNAGHAKWDRDTEKLTVTLKLARDLDRINF